MFRIRRIHDDIVPANRHAIAQVQAILRAQFPLLAEREVAGLPEKLRDPLKHRFRSILFVAEDQRGAVQGFAFLMHEPALDFCYLDFISAAKRMTGRGIGGALYQRVRQEALALAAVGIFMECLPDDPELSRQPEIRRQNVARLRFYERFGAYPIAGTIYEQRVHPGDDNPPYLVFDGLGRDAPLRRDAARRAVRAILERKYGHLCSPEYVDRVVASFRDDPVRLRPARYNRAGGAAAPDASPAADERIALIINERHEIHHVRERGYVQAPVRVRAIMAQLSPTGLFLQLPARHHGEQHLRAVHEPGFVEYLRRVCRNVEPGRSVYPYVFPIRNGARPPRELPVRAGYYCIDTFTPLNRNAYLAAARAVDCALTGAGELLRGRRLAYALVRPPGHHAERRAFGGFCYFNSAAIAANFLCPHGRVAMLDLDYHHGNGQQDIFYARDDVLTVSIHGHPRIAYPYFSGFDDERGEGRGRGLNLNLPLPEETDGARYAAALERALGVVSRFRPQFLVVCLGLDTARGDPTGSWTLGSRDFERNGRAVGALRLPTLVVQEGGYNTRNLGVNARQFFRGLWAGAAA